MKISPKMLLRVIVTVFFYGTFCVDCAIINSPPNHHANNIIRKDTKNTTVVEIPIDDHAEIVAIQPEQNDSEENRKETSKLAIRPTKMFPHKKVLTTIMHPLPKTMHDLMPHETNHPSHVDHKKFHDDFLKHEVPKLQKKLHHHYTVEEMRQRRKQLKEKWHAKHEENKKKNHGDKDTPEIYEQVTRESGGFLGKNREKTEASPESSAMDAGTPLHSSGAKDKRSIEDERNAQPRIQGVPVMDALDLMARIKEEEMKKNQTKKPETKNAQHEDFNNERSERVAGIDVHPGMENEQVTIRIDTPPYYRNLTYDEKILIQRPLWGAGKAAEETAQEPPLETQQNGENSLAEANPKQRVSVIAGFPIYDALDIRKADLMYAEMKAEQEAKKRNQTKTPGRNSAQQEEREFFQVAEVPTAEERSARVPGIDVHPGMENEQVTIRIDTPPYYRNLTYDEKILIQRPLWGAGKSAEEVDDQGFERAAGIDVHPGMENEQVTIRIDTPPYYRNLTYDEKILIQRPLWGAGKAAEEVDDQGFEKAAGIDVHPGMENEQVTIRIDTPPYYRNLTYDEKILIQRPLWGAGKSAEQVNE